MNLTFAQSPSLAQLLLQTGNNLGPLAQGVGTSYGWKNGQFQPAGAGAPQAPAPGTTATGSVDASTPAAGAPMNLLPQAPGTSASAGVSATPPAAPGAGILDAIKGMSPQSITQMLQGMTANDQSVLPGMGGGSPGGGGSLMDAIQSAGILGLGGS